ncbi:LapA family protein [Corynebacterium sp. 335C]
MTNPNDQFRDPNVAETRADLAGADHDAALAPATTGAADVRHQEEAPRKAKGSFAGSTWVALIVGAIILVVLLAFIMQNMQNVTLTLFAWTFNFPLGVGMLLAAIGGALLMGLVGGVRIMQLRRQVRR